MKGKNFLVQWSAASAKERAKELRAEGWQVDVESEDGARAYKMVKADPPDVVVIDLSRLPSHGRVAAEILWQTKTTREIPVVFVDGTEEAVQKAKAKVKNATFTTTANLNKVLANLTK